MASVPFRWRDDRLDVDFARLLLYHRPSVAVRAVNLPESQTDHHARQVLLSQIVVHRIAAADALHDFGREAALDETRIRGRLRHTIEAQDLVGHQVHAHEHLVVRLHLLDVLVGQPIYPAVLLLLLSLHHLLAQSHRLTIYVGIVDRVADGAHDVLHQPRAVAAVLRVRNQVHRIAGAAERRTVHQF